MKNKDYCISSNIRSRTLIEAATTVETLQQKPPSYRSFPLIEAAPSWEYKIIDINWSKIIFKDKQDKVYNGHRDILFNENWQIKYRNKK